MPPRHQLQRDSRPAGSRVGFALVAALAALVIVSALAAGLLFAAQQEQRAARFAVAGERALAAAELGLARAPSLWLGVGLTSVAPGTTEERAIALADGDAVIVRLTRASARTAWVVAVAESGAAQGRARRAAATLFRLDGATDDSTVLTAVTQRAWVQTF